MMDVETIFDSDREEYEFMKEKKEQPMTETEIKRNLITNWTIEKWGDAFVICGNIYNDMRKRFPDGTYIHTSRLKEIDFVNGIAKTRNSTYNLEQEGNR